jgi:hypothetical protein
MLQQFFAIGFKPTLPQQFYGLMYFSFKLTSYKTPVTVATSPAKLLDQKKLLLSLPYSCTHYTSLTTSFIAKLQNKIMKSVAISR